MAHFSRPRNTPIDLTKERSFEEKQTSGASTVSTDVAMAQPKDASAAVKMMQENVQASLPFSDRADYDDAARGFLGTIENARIVDGQGRVVWSLEPYDFLKREA